MALSSIYFLGKFLGGIIQIYLTDIFGRKIVLISGTLFLFFVLTATIYAKTYNHIYWLRLFYGLL